MAHALGNDKVSGQPSDLDFSSEQPRFTTTSHTLEQPEAQHGTNVPSSPSLPPVFVSQCGQASVTSGLNFVSNQIYHHPSSLPIQSVPRVIVTLPFEIKFLTPAIKICAGCRNGYARAADGKSCLPAPKDLCLVHKEQHLYYNVVNCKQQLSSLTNVHYHADINCVKVRCPDFNPKTVQIPENIKLKLTPEHWVFLLQTFGIV